MEIPDKIGDLSGVVIPEDWIIDIPEKIEIQTDVPDRVVMGGEDEN